MTKPPRWIALLIAAAAAGVVALWSVIDYRVRPRLITGPMVQNVTTDSFTLVWQMHPRRPASVQLSRDGQRYLVNFLAERQGDYDVATVSGLEPGTEYEYEIGCDGCAPARHRVRTDPGSGGSFRFLAFGDSGVGGLPQRRLARYMLPLQPDLIIHTGDIVYPDGEPEDFPAKLYRPYAELLACAPLYPCLGNHEFRTRQGRPVLDAFVLPRNGPAGQEPERHYWFDFGDVRFVALDDNQDYPVFGETVAPWLDTVLAAAGDRWKIAFFHEPVYTNGKYEPAEKLLRSVVPVFDRHGVALVLCGHNHMYERTHPIRDGQVVGPGQGTVYVTTGAGGANLYTAKLPPPGFMAAWCDTQHSFTVVDVTPQTLSLRQIGIDGSVIDEHLITRAPPAPPATAPAGGASRPALLTRLENAQ